ncbi:hypothetical protein CANCADRAFT_1791 [Tortispora caseinolytica NRRL Y-17796]|uniref:DNA polymerase epsilon catalytic subunit n=1 Tax=Tortispora caseinolytica NRRL Y-17796 TaxID=767744 RepID=A0A1E4TE88_9ASCO|nr:hypothetical protein CANCADRAFT_1791 [Tortispora caseinolytica NRRL Y-17796]
MAVKSSDQKSSYNAKGSRQFRPKTPVVDLREDTKKIDELDARFGFPRYESGPKKIGWMFNMHSTTYFDELSDNKKQERAAVDYYFLADTGGTFKATVVFDPYFLVACKPGTEADVEEYLRRLLVDTVKSTTRITKEDLNLANHLVGKRRQFIKLTFHTITLLLQARKTLFGIVKPASTNSLSDAFTDYSSHGFDIDFNGERASVRDSSECIVDIREYDVPYHVRVAIDKAVRIGKWYEVEAVNGETRITELTDRVYRPDPVVLAFDIETTKDTLKFPDAKKDRIMMISYMIDGEGFLITNRDIVSEDIDDFEYTPKPEYPGVFTIFNEEGEKAVLERFFEHIREAAPNVIVTYNGDFFDWPFVDARANFHGLNMYEEIGFSKDSEDEYKSRHCAHMDAFRWVKRDSYLPQGSQGLKAVTTSKLGYNPNELDPELMTPYAYEKPQVLAEYSVSDAVATYYLYMKYVHPFIFSLCNIIPLNPDEVLRKGTGTLCEMLLMVQAFQNDIIFPNKYTDRHDRFYKGHLVESETYVGGHVESLEAGVFRSDIPSKFRMDPTAFDELLANLHNSLKFAIEVENGKSLDDVENYDEIYEEIRAKLTDLRDNPVRTECPQIYHLDVSSMYPNIMITNRLQPDSVVNEADCAVCDFNKPGKTCDRRLPWMWRGEYFPPTNEEYNMVKAQLQKEKFPPRYPGGEPRLWNQLPASEKSAALRKRLGIYSRKTYHKMREAETVERTAVICQRENPFYVDTVRDFRDRRYEFKNLQKVWKKKASEIPANDAIAKDEAEKMIVLYDSLQLAHKCILNSFYGYVMRKGSRWYSMEMAGITCLTGATIIQMARSIVERVGRPLELDTDGIWCIIPKSFPENYKVILKEGKPLTLSYPCVVLNAMVHEKFTNPQYETLVDKKSLQYSLTSENSIFFEVDGPYKAMVLPTSTEEDKNLKKRYAVFNDDGSLAELKGFEIKRRGELQLIKIFQSGIFKVFLEGNNLKECYAAVAKVANQWLDVLDSKGSLLADSEVIDLISENRSMSKSLEEYGQQKSTSITTAKRLSEFLGSSMVKDKGLACKFIISARPKNAPVAERAVPVAIFSASMEDKAFYLRKWLKDSSLTDFDLRTIIDWSYYAQRLGNMILKLIIIPAGLQGISNPVPRLAEPDWLKARMTSNKSRQLKLTSMLVKKKPMKDITNRPHVPLEDVEDFGQKDTKIGIKNALVIKRKRTIKDTEIVEPTKVAAVAEEKPSEQDDYVSWLMYQKKKWKHQKATRERRRHLFGDRLNNVAENDIRAMSTRSLEGALSSVWNIVQIRSTGAPGLLRCFVENDNAIRSVRVIVPRTVYINFITGDIPDTGLPASAQFTKSYDILPNGFSSDNLYKLEIDEAGYLALQEDFNSILYHPSVEGVYETKLDHVQRAIIALGSRCKVDLSIPGVLGAGIDDGFHISTLKKVSDKSQSCLNSEDANLVYVLRLKALDREIFTIMHLNQQHPPRIITFDGPKSGDKLPSMARMYKEHCERKRAKGRLDESIFSYPNELEFMMEYHNNGKKFEKSLNAVFNSFPSKTICVVQGISTTDIVSRYSSLKDIPFIDLSVHLTEYTLPVIGWNAAASKKIVGHIMGLGNWLDHVKSMAAYGGIPPGNLKPGDSRYVVDIAYARKLKESNCVLWWSGGLSADHGGHEKDKVFGLLDDAYIPTINTSGSYNYVSLDMDIRNLLLSSLLSAVEISSLEGHSSIPFKSSQGEDSETNEYADNMFTMPAVAILCETVQVWWKDALKGNFNADILLQNVIGWCISPQSKLYNSYLHYHLMLLAKRAYLQLVSGLRKLGCTVIHADMNRLLVQTSKSHMSSARSYATYLVKSIRDTDLFKYLDLRVTEYWQYLLWMDQENYAGFATRKISENGEHNLELLSGWLIKSYLPAAVQSEFDGYVIEFANAMKVINESLQNNDISAVLRIDQNEFEDYQDDNIEPDLKEKDPLKRDSEKLLRIVVKKISKPLKQYIAKLISQQTDPTLSPEEKAEYEFPQLPGSYLPMSNPALEMVKFVTAVFELVPEIENTVRLLRKDLLKRLNVSEFSDESIFKNPARSVILRSVACENCSFVMDIDFCRDENLSSGSVSGENHDITLKCKACGSHLSKVAIEELLISSIEQKLLRYQVQDLQCRKCKRIRDGNLRLYCECSGEWGEVIPRSTVAEDMQAYYTVAGYYDFKLLRSSIQEIYA